MSKPNLKELLNKEKRPRTIGSWIEPDVKTVINPATGADVRIFRTNHANRIAHRVIIAWMNNGQDQGKAYRSVHKTKSIEHAASRACVFFKRPETLKAIDAYYNSQKPLEEKQDKDYALKFLKGWIEINILDYFGDSWSLLTPTEMREQLPKSAQVAISEVNINETIRTDENGAEIMHRTVRFKLVDKLKALETMAKIEKWISTMNLRLNVNLEAEDLMAAGARRIRLLSEDIEGEFEHVENEGS